MAIYDQKCKLSKRTNRQISLALLVAQQILYILNEECYSFLSVYCPPQLDLRQSDEGAERILWPQGARFFIKK
jgi:hypothetical protein